MKDADVVKDAGAPTGGANASLGASLLGRLRAGQPGAWERLARLYGETVYGWCRRAGVSEADAADVSQEVFAAVVRRLGDFRRERPGDSFRGWLWTITRNKVRDHWRRADQVKAVGGTTAQEIIHQVPEDAPPDAEAGPEAEAGGLYRRALELIQTEFEERTWRAFLLVTVEARLPADVAAELGMTPGAVYIAKSRVLKRLREEFGDLIEGGE
jgi:RNA polymerase sigma-70 factor (ECF subfamily)